MPCLLLNLLKQRTNAFTQIKNRQDKQHAVGRLFEIYPCLHYFIISVY
jgi:hypothetical protein